ncbi:MAG: alpha-glucosidase, partial [bacterium]
AGPGAGFTTGDPWLPIVAEAETLNVETQTRDPGSTLSLTRRLAALRAATPALQMGAQRSLDAGRDVLAWLREDDGERLLAAVNFAGEPVDAELPSELRGRARLVISTDADRADGDVDLGALSLAPSEAVLLRLG